MLCHDLARTAIEDVEGYPIPPLPLCIERYVEAARLTNRNARCIGIAVNASHLDERAYLETRALLEAQTELHCTDPIRDGVDGLIACALDGAERFPSPWRAALALVFPGTLPQARSP